MLGIKVAGRWLSTIGAYGPVTLEYGLHGSEAASWQMRPQTRHPSLRSNSAVEVYDGGLRVWVGTLLEPGSSGDFAAKGIWHQAEGTPCLTVGGGFTTTPDDAIAGAYFRGETSWSYSTSISTSPWATANGGLSLADVLNGYSSETGTRWAVSPNYMAYVVADPTTPMWHVPQAVAGRGLTPAEDEFATHLVGRFLVSAGVFDVASVGSADAATYFGRRTVNVDLTSLGFITAARATSILSGMFLRAGARMGWAEGLELGRKQIVTPGGRPVPLSQVMAGQMIRLCGTVDLSRAGQVATKTDIVIASSRYTEGSDRIALTPVGYAPRNLRDVLDLSLIVP